MLHNFFKLSFRNFQKHRSSTLIHLLGLTLGVSACLAIFQIVDFEFNTDNFHPDNQRIYRLVGTLKFDATSPEDRLGFVPYALPAAVRNEISGLEQVAAFVNFEAQVQVPESGQQPARKFARRQMDTERAGIVLAEPGYFNIFKYEWLAGDARTALSQPYQVVLSAKKAQLYFGDLPVADVLGKELIYDDSLRVRVTGVVQDWAQPTDFTFTDFVSFSTIPSSLLRNSYNLNEWTDVWSASQAFVKLAPGVLPGQVEAQFPAFNKSHFTGQFQFKTALQPLHDVHFNADFGDNYTRKAHLPTLYTLAGVAGFILLLAAINFINLSTAQSFQRAREVGVRKVLGSGRISLITQYLGETLLLTATAATLSALVVPLAFQQFKSFIPPGLNFELSPRVLGFLAATVLVTTLLAGFYPAFALSAFAPARTLKNQVTLNGNRSATLRKGLIVFQFTISLVFILGTLLVYRQINFMRHKDLGFQSDAVVTLQTPRGADNQLAVLAPQIQQLAGVSKTTLQLFEPMGQNFGLDRLTYQGQTFDAAYKMGDEHFVPFYEMKLLAGRNFLQSTTAQELVVTESLVKKMGLNTPEEAVGKSLTWHEKPYPIVGVVADFHQQSLHEKMPPTFLTTAEFMGSLAVKLRGKTPDEVSATLSQMEGLWTALYPDHKMAYTFLDDDIARFYEKERQTSRLVNLVTVIALLISCLGLFGLATFAAQQRTKEIGIRKVLGASVAGITAMLTTDFLKLVALALVLASPVAYYLMQLWLSDFAYAVGIQWWMFVAAGLAATVIAFLTVSVQSVRAALANPVQSLRSE